MGWKRSLSFEEFQGLRMSWTKVLMVNAIFKTHHDAIDGRDSTLHDRCRRPIQVTFWLSSSRLSSPSVLLAFMVPESSSGIRRRSLSAPSLLPGSSTPMPP